MPNCIGRRTNLKYDYVFTVFTATYNRKDFLKNLYQDLVNQSFKDFEWLIVDDGSEDETERLVKAWIKEDKLSIKYFYKKNGGKHTAINLGVKHAKGELVFLADSDDRLLSNGLEVMYSAWSKLKNKDEFCGVAGLFSYDNEEIVGTKFKEDLLEIPFVDVYFKYNMKGDKAVFFTTDIMKQYPFPEEENVKFIMEAVVWYEMSKKYKIKCINEVIQIKEYLGDGLTKNSYSERNVRGLAFSYLCLINQKTYPLIKFPKMWMNTYVYLCSNSLLGNLSYFNRINRIRDKILYLLFFPLGYVLFYRIKRYLKSEKIVSKLS